MVASRVTSSPATSACGGVAMPPAARANFRAEPPAEGSDLSAVYDEFRQYILPYGSGNLHPGFMGWVQGAGTAEGMLAEMLAGQLEVKLREGGAKGLTAIEMEVEENIGQAAVYRVSLS